MLGLPDTYTLRARVFPAILATVPAIALIAALVSWKDIGFSHSIGGFGLLAILWLFSDQARRTGKQLEPGLIKKMGGLPSTTMLRHADTTFDAVTKARFLQFIASKLKEQPPTRVAEKKDPTAADAYYARAGNWLREHTRDTKTFSILFDENVTYGARRNLLGLKPLAIGLNIAVVAICYSLIVWRIHIPGQSDAHDRLMFVFVVAAIHAICILAFVNEQAVFQAARQYARQLLISCEALNNDVKPPAAPRKKAKTRQ